MSQAKRCPQCGTVCDLEARTCPQCNHFFRTAFDPANPEQSTRQAANPLTAAVESPPPATGIVDVGKLKSLHRKREARFDAGRLLKRTVSLVLLLALAWCIWVLYRNGTFGQLKSHLPIVNHLQQPTP